MREASIATIRVGPLVAQPDASNIGFLNRQERNSSVLVFSKTRARKLLAVISMLCLISE